MIRLRLCVSFFLFFNDTATTEIYTLSLHDALPIYGAIGRACGRVADPPGDHRGAVDRKSTRLNSSHEWRSYAVFCLKTKRKSIGKPMFSSPKPTMRWSPQRARIA